MAGNVKQLYISYLLRLWQPVDPASGSWMVSLEDPHTHRVFYFSSLEAFWTYMNEQLSTQTNDNEAKKTTQELNDK